MKKTTTIQIEIETRRQLYEMRRKQKCASYDELIRKLIEAQE